MASSTIISAIAIAISILAVAVSVAVYFGNRHENRYKYLADIWYAVFNDCLETPWFFNRAITAHFDQLLNDEDRGRYDAFCHRVWGLFEDIVTNGFQTDIQFRGILRWTVAHHLRWVQLNPQLYESAMFWTTVETIYDEPPIVTWSAPLPTKDGDIDWDIVSQDYHRYILGPFAPEMVTLGGSPMRNRLVAELAGGYFGRLSDISIADFGCGPGNLIPHLANQGAHVVGVDRSVSALRIAATKAARHNVEFEGNERDLRYFDLSRRFDLIVCVNSIVPGERSDVILMLRSIVRHMAPEGRLLAIMPSYDATVYLRQLHHDFYRTNANEDQAERVSRALVDSKRANDAECSYADDGRNSQCYHTPETMGREFSYAGLLIERMQKIYYPWELCRRFDYGYFPDAAEEIWDWYVVARLASISDV